MRIVVLDGFTLNPGDNPWDPVAELGKLIVYDRTPAELVVQRARGAEIVLTNKTRLTASTLDKLPDLRFISVLATGYDVVDVSAARERGIVVSNVPEYSTEAVAQHTFALLLELCHRVGLHDQAVHAGCWSACPDFSFWLQAPFELAGLVLGIVGFGRIGRRVAQIAESFGMSVVAYGPRRPADLPAQVSWVTLQDLFRLADVVSLHCPLTPQNERFVNEPLIASMKPSAFLINTARGKLVDEEALARALCDGRLAGAAVDVVSEEPIRPDNPLLRAPNCIITSHLAWASLPARRRLMQITAANIQAFLSGHPINVVS
ncbi:MAG: D-2-hydroxyacid dehydrogenase [Candidatus Binatia bacterium]|nr:D-2-hydroxyacid dehydrogenase [Candidatus Binatia bacterium]